MRVHRLRSHFIGIGARAKAVVQRFVVPGIPLVVLTVFLLGPRLMSSGHSDPRLQTRSRLRAFGQAVGRAIAANGGRCPARPTDIAPSLAGRLSRDPWGTGLLVTCSDGGYAIISAGPDQQFGTSDDIVEGAPGSAPGPAHLPAGTNG